MRENEDDDLDVEPDRGWEENFESLAVTVLAQGDRHLFSDVFKAEKKDVCQERVRRGRRDGKSGQAGRRGLSTKSRAVIARKKNQDRKKKERKWSEMTRAFHEAGFFFKREREIE